MLVMLADAWHELEDDDNLRVAILTGAGGDFCTGMDLKAFAAGPSENPYQHRFEADPDLHWKALLRHHYPSKPLIAAVEGYVSADGTDLKEAREVADVIAANGPRSIKAIKQSVNETEGMSEIEGLKRELEIGTPIFMTEDAQEGPKAFSEKRTPEFKGK